VSPPLRIAHAVERTDVEGPGRRAAVWVQGCSIRCAGCFNPHTWPAEGGTPVDPLVLADRLLGDDVEGITFLGGEPFDQAVAVAVVARRFRLAGRSVMTVTGHPYERLRDGGAPGWADLLAATDLLVDGPYDRSRPELHRPWTGSANQRFIHLTERYRDRLGDAPPATVEVRIRPDGTVFVNGMADRQSLAGLRRTLGQRP
jgi:anaerobic ribonucleoside-triphosphate reductase activating protein